MSTVTIPRATLADLAKADGKAELIAGRIVPLMATGFRPNRIAARIFRSLDDFAAATGTGFAFTDNMGFAVTELISGRESFSPDASFHPGPPPANDMTFVEGAPVFAVEVRSDSDYGRAAETALASKRADYFEAGAQVVWDVDPVANIIRSFTVQSPTKPIEFTPDTHAHAGQAVPNWVIDVEQLFRP